MTWRYGLIRSYNTVFSDYEYAVHEIFDTKDGESWTAEPVTFYGSSRDQVESVLLMALNDIRRETDDAIEARKE